MEDGIRRKKIPINELEFLATRHVVFPLFPSTKYHRIITGHSTSVSYNNKQGRTHSPMCNVLTIEIMLENLIKHLFHLSAVHIPRK